MKPRHLAFPALALVAAGILLGVQRKEVAELREGNAGLRTRIAGARDAAQAPAPSPFRHRDKPATDSEPIDWKKLAGEIGGIKQQSRDGDIRQMMALKRRLLAMEPLELVAALDEIAALDVDVEMRRELEDLILDPLAKKDPETALKRFRDRLGEQQGVVSWQLSGAFTRWAGKDLAAATAWYDGELAAGTFDSKSLDGKNPLRDRFESNLIAKMLEADLTGAKAWLSAKSPDARVEILGGAGFQNLQEKDQAAHAELVRSQLGDTARLDLIGKHVANLAQGSSAAEAAAYLERIDARPDERQRSRQAILDVAAKIKDPAKRRELLDRFE